MAYKKSLREDGYLNDFHKKSSLASMKAAKSSQKHPPTLKEVREQIARHKKALKNHS